MYCEKEVWTYNADGSASNGSCNLHWTGSYMTGSPQVSHLLYYPSPSSPLLILLLSSLLFSKMFQGSF